MTYFFIIFLIFAGLTGIIIPQAQGDEQFSDKVTFDIDGFPIILNNSHVTDLKLDWNSEYLPYGEIIFDEPTTGTIEIKIPKNMPRATNLDFETTLWVLNSDNEESIIHETESECHYILLINVKNSNKLEIFTSSVAAGTWESVVINNPICQTNVDHSYDENEIKQLTLKEQLRENFDWDDIICSNPVHVLTERSNGKIACVNQSTAEKFGWYIYFASELGVKSFFEIEKQNKIFKVEYEILGASIQETTYDHDVRSVVIFLDTERKGKFIVSLPRELLDSKMDYCPPKSENPPDDTFFVLIDHIEHSFLEISTTSQMRTLEIPFENGITQIEIFGTCYI